MPVVGHDEDLRPALDRADQVIAPSPTVLKQAHDRGYPGSGWPIVPNALLHNHAAPPPDRRETLRRRGTIAIPARLGPEKNTPALLDAGRLVQRPVSIVLAEAGFEQTPVVRSASETAARTPRHICGWPRSTADSPGTPCRGGWPKPAS